MKLRMPIVSFGDLTFLDLAVSVWQEDCEITMSQTWMIDWKISNRLGKWYVNKGLKFIPLN
ncbi:hypothetical protein GCM10017764_30070 [Sphingobacterium griseoflavum]|uniref:Uncharacterized protein n=1 Tax=Sphingobacterium griseoflavum TaxID=1474952 RepID=A0ABQ3I1A6_9SPHI|nr:hypothetical protein GCM10017764_30070 [Sphingobacterium griseoflavum]